MKLKIMMAKLLVFVFVLCLGGRNASAQSSTIRLPAFMGRKVSMVVPEVDADGFFPKGPASICIEAPPQRQCYTAPGDHGRFPSAVLVQVEKDKPALLFSAASGGVSGFSIHYALLQPGDGADLRDLFSSKIFVSNLSEHQLWINHEISNAPIFVTANFVWGHDESHFSPHRYIISAYVYKYSSMTDNFNYDLHDQYMTDRKYDWDGVGKVRVLSSEKQEAIGRLKRVKAKAAKTN